MYRATFGAILLALAATGAAAMPAPPATTTGTEAAGIELVSRTSTRSAVRAAACTDQEPFRRKRKKGYCKAKKQN